MTFRDFFSLMTMFALVACMLTQIMIEPSKSNTICTLIISVSTIGTLAYLYWADAYSKAPLSSLVLIGLLFTGLFGALLFQTLYWNPVVKYLLNAELTFVKLALYQFVAISSHYTYLIFFQTNKLSSSYGLFSIKTILRKLGLYNIPSVYSVWAIAIIGLCAFTLGKILPGEIGRAIFNFKFLMWFPFFIVIYIHNFGRKYANRKKQYMLITLFFLLICCLGIGFNSRGLIVVSLVNLFILATAMLLFERKKHNISFYTKLALLIICMFGLLKPFSSFSDAMLLARSDRGDVSPIEMLTNTFDIYFNSSREELIDNSKFIQNKIYTNYDEDYIENGIITRFVLTKFHDNAYYYSSSLRDSGKTEIINHIENKLIAIMPQPMIELIGIELDKMEHMNSSTDILVHETTGRRLGGLKVPSTFVDLEVIFGPYSLLIFFFMSFIFFVIIELYRNVDSKYGLVISFPFFAIASRYVLFQLPVYGIQGIVNFLLRGFLLDVLIFCAIMFMFNLVFKPFLNNSREQNDKVRVNTHLS